jgi:acetate kinase
VRVLVVNTGSSSLKLSVLDPSGGEEPLAATTVERWEGEEDVDAVQAFLDEAGDLDAVGHRVVHGGPDHRGPARVDETLVAELDSLAHLAPLHNPRAVGAMRAVSRMLPDLPAVASFDTAFHATMPAAAATYALPREWNERWRLRRYGFHGLSHAGAVRRAAEIVARPLEDLRLVSCHLGAGASLAAVVGGRSVDTTMGFTPLAGLVMKTRSGSIDPGLLVWLQRHAGLSVAAVEETLEHESGMRGLSGTSGDLRDVLRGAAAGDDDCALAYDAFVHRLVREAAGMAASAGGIDVLVMTGGIGEHSPQVRRDAAAALRFLGVTVDEAANEHADGDADISAHDATTRTVVVTAREDAEIARQVHETLGVTRT